MKGIKPLGLGFQFLPNKLYQRYVNEGPKLPGCSLITKETGRTAVNCTSQDYFSPYTNIPNTLMQGKNSWAANGVFSREAIEIAYARSHGNPPLY